ncbi:MAG: hypothetical protein GY795_29715 [Desulfobacterales bacterium]|nr:hypothetical protein [Desulfobacterales bacterium]
MKQHKVGFGLMVPIYTLDEDVSSWIWVVASYIYLHAVCSYICCVGSSAICILGSSIDKVIIIIGILHFAPKAADTFRRSAEMKFWH